MATSATLLLALVALYSVLIYFRCSWNGSEGKLPGKAAAVAASTAAAATEADAVAAATAGEAAAVAGEANAVARGAAVAPGEVVVSTASPDIAVDVMMTVLLPTPLRVGCWTGCGCS